jgi:hypothetical protein
MNRHAEIPGKALFFMISGTRKKADLLFSQRTEDDPIPASYTHQGDPFPIPPHFPSLFLDGKSLPS